MKKRAIDFTAAATCLAVLFIAWLYPDQIRGQVYLMWGAGISAALFLTLAVTEEDPVSKMVSRGRMELPSDTGMITETVLLSEEDTELMVWDLYGKTASVIGRDVKENQVDIDLGKSAYASMVDIEHAVLNFSTGNWYVEDLGSSNGISVKKSGDGRVYKLSADTPCRLERGDCLYVGLNRLLFR